MKWTTKFVTVYVFVHDGFGNKYWTENIATASLRFIEQFVCFAASSLYLPLKSNDWIVRKFAEELLHIKIGNGLVMKVLVGAMLMRLLYVEQVECVISGGKYWVGWIFVVVWMRAEKFQLNRFVNFSEFRKSFKRCSFLQNRTLSYRPLSVKMCLGYRNGIASVIVHCENLFVLRKNVVM